MNLLSSNASAGAAAGGLSCTNNFSLKFTHLNPNPCSFYRCRRPSEFPTISSKLGRLPKPLRFATPKSAGPCHRTFAGSGPPAATDDGKDANTITLVGEEDVSLEGVIQFEKPGSSTSNLISKWGRVALLAAGDVLALLLFSAVGRFNHGFPVLDLETLKTADPFIAGWFLSAYFLGGYGEDGQGMNGRSKAIVTALKSWVLGMPLGIGIRAIEQGHLPPTNFMLVTMGSTAVLLVGWRSLLSSILFNEKTNKNDDYRRGSPFELFELLTSLVRRW